MLTKYIKKINKVVLLLTLSDVFVWGPFLIITAISGVYLATKFNQSVVEVVGLGTAIYFLTRALLQIPIGIFTDKIKNDRDEIFILSLGVILMGLPYVFYPQISAPWQYFLLQVVFGLGVSLNLTNWRKLFALNVDTGREGLQYASYETVISMATALLSVFVGYIASLGEIYFDITIMVSGIIMMAGCFWVLMIYKIGKRKTNI